MTKTRKIDFKIDQEFYDALGEDDLQRHETYLFFFPLVCLKVLYEYLDRIIGKKTQEVEGVLNERGFFDYIPPSFITKKELEAPIYRFLLFLMKNDLRKARRLIEEKKVEINKPVLDYPLLLPFKLAARPFEKNIVGLTPLTVSAILGRHEIFQVLIERGADPCQKITLISLKAYYIHLSVNECLLMNAIFQWYKSGRRDPLPSDYVEGLIHSIILAGSKCPSLVSYDHLIENTIRVTWYWGELKEMVGDKNLLSRLNSLNPQVMKEILRY